MSKMIIRSAVMLHGSILLMMLSLADIATAVSSSIAVSVPEHHTAMEDDLEVSFELLQPNAFTHNAIVHLEYLTGDAVLPSESRHLSRPKKLASHPVPLGLKKGTVVFQCGTLKHAGPHRAFITVNGKRRAESGILQVAWPQMTINVPKRLETYSSDVSVTVAFTRSLCSTFTTYGDWGTKASPFFGRGRKSKLGFASRLDLVECSKNSGDDYDDAERQDCQAPTDDGDRRLWTTHHIQNIYRKSSFSVNLNCSTWGQPGTFRLFLRTNLSHASVVARSAAIRVVVNPDYKVKSVDSEFVLPCLKNDIKPFSVSRPACAAVDDKIRVYGQGKLNKNMLTIKNIYKIVIQLFFPAPGWVGMVLFGDRNQ
jgi:hypothetical protein